jgi:hypothetical protein
VVVAMMAMMAVELVNTDFSESMIISEVSLILVTPKRLPVASSFLI